ncbi:MAG: 6-phospho-beta-glucosidase [Propionibacteriales bacterium]|nr:6-phospho-beta-glucosidase [Propionibacteriales bacterium]
MRLTILGGGGFRVPLIYRALGEDDELGVSELVLYDVDVRRLDSVHAVLKHIAAGVTGRAPAVRLTTDLRDALTGTDFVFSAIRVGGLAGRVCDERAAMSEGVLGQETTGAGGICFGLRTIPEAQRVASAIRDVAPESWLINFTNPAGMVTEAMSAILGDRVVGICDSPVGLFRRVSRVLGIDVDRAEFDYAGLNHLGWLNGVRVDGQDLLPALLADSERLRQIEEGRLFGPQWLRALGSIPNEYLWYWYFRSDAVAAEQSAAETRGEFLLREQRAFYTDPPADDREVDPAVAYARWDEIRRQREESYMAEGRRASGAGERSDADLEGGGYDQVALALMRAVARDRPATLVLNVRNRGILPFLDDDAVVEVPCRVDAEGPRPLGVGPLDPHARGLVTTVKDVERTTIEAANRASRELAVRALAVHPLVGSVSVARRILESQTARLPELRRVFDG